MSGKLPEDRRVVFDCSVFARALISPKGPGGACLEGAQHGMLRLVVSAYVIQEIRELPLKIKPKLGVTSDRVERLIQDLAKYAELRESVQEHFIHPVDADDSHYVNLAIASHSRLIVSRDKHLLMLEEMGEEFGRDFRKRYPELRITTPEVVAEELRAQREQKT